MTMRIRIQNCDTVCHLLVSDGPVRRVVGPDTSIDMYVWHGHTVLVAELPDGTCTECGTGPLREGMTVCHACSDTSGT